jgi:hypothetical protein
MRTAGTSPSTGSTCAQLTVPITCRSRADAQAQGGRPSTASCVPPADSRRCGRPAAHSDRVLNAASKAASGLSNSFDRT